MRPIIQADDNALSHSEYKTCLKVSHSQLWTFSSEEEEWKTETLQCATVLVAPRQALLKEIALISGLTLFTVLMKVHFWSCNFPEKCDPSNNKLNFILS